MTSLNDIVDIRTGYTFRYGVEGLASGTVAVIQTKDLSRLHKLDQLPHIDFQGDRHFLQAGDVLLSARGSFTAAVPEISHRQMVATSSMFVLRPHTPVINPQYLAAYLNSATGQAVLRQIASSAYIPTITKQQLGQIPIPLPPLATQGLIAALTDNINLQTETLKRQRQSLNRLINLTITSAIKESNV